MIRAFSFLQRHPKSGILYFRRRIPQRYRDSFNGKHEFKRSLHTCDKKLAAPMAMTLYFKLQNQFNKIDGVCNVGEDNFFGKITASVFDAQGRKRERTFDTGDYERDNDLADAFEEKYASVVAPAPPVQVLAPATQGLVESKKLAAVMDEFCSEKKSGNEWTSKTADEYEKVFSLLLQYIGNVEISTITKQQIRSFCDDLKQLPPNASKGKFQGKTLKQIRRMAYTKTISTRTYNQNYVTRYSALFSWAVHEDYCAINPFERRKIKNTGGKASEERNPFTLEELKQVFSPGIYNKSRLKDWQYWVPLVALYSGARQQEIAQLRVQDITEEGDIYAMHFVSYEDVKEANGSLKNTQSKRFAPVHPQLIAWGFLKHVAMCRDCGEDKLFPDLFTTKKIKAGEKVSRWFCNTHMRHSGLLEVAKQRKISFHSLRHNFTDCFKKTVVQESLVSQICGRKHNGITYGRYGSEFTLQEMYSAMTEHVKFDLQ